MNRWQQDIVDRIRDDGKHKKDTVLSYRESHIAMNGILTDAALIDMDITTEEVATLAQAKAEGRIAPCLCKDCYYYTKQEGRDVYNCLHPKHEFYPVAESDDTCLSGVPYEAALEAQEGEDR